VDVAAVDADRRRAEELLGLCGLERLDHSQHDLCAGVAREVTDPRDDLLETRAAVEVEDLDGHQRPPLKDARPSIRSQASTCCALSAPSCSTSAIAAATRSSGTE